MVAHSHRWRPLEGPSDPGALEVPELRAFQELWRRERERLRDHGAIKAFNERMARWWAIETGIIERLYDVSEGVTLQLIEHGFEASLIPHGEANLPAEELVAILRDHRESLDAVMDVVGGTRTLTVGWIKELHALLTRHQPTSDAMTPDGRWVKVPLRRGEWKLQPNNPLTADGTLHEYCPPEQVGSEMDQLLAIHASLPEMPEVRAAWLHHAFTQIHPFQDGNGRVARAIASLDFIRAGLFPMLVRRNERDRYIDALRAADSGDLSELVRFCADAQVGLLRRAISEAEGVVDARAGLQTVLAAAAQKRQRREEASAEQRTAFRARIGDLMKEAEGVFQQTGVEVQRQVAGIRVERVQRARSGQRWFRDQLLRIGRQHGYWVDLNEPLDWVRLQLRDGGVTDIVVACHFIGNPSPGAAVAVVFVTHRSAGEAAGGSDPTTAAADPLTLLVDEDPQAQRARFVTWLESARNGALALWTRYL